MSAIYPIKTTLLKGDKFEVCRLLNEDKSLTVQFNGDVNDCMVALFYRWQEEEKVSLKLALKSGVSGETLSEMRKFESLTESEQLNKLFGETRN